MIGENDCAWCGRKFNSKDEHDEHYKECSKNVKDTYSDEELFVLVHNEKNY